MKTRTGANHVANTLCWFHLKTLLLIIIQGYTSYGADLDVVIPEWILNGSTAQLECKLTLDEGNYLVSVAWSASNDFTHTNPTTAPNVIYYVVNGNITGGDEADRVELDTSDLTLTIPKVLETDERRYFCLVQTARGGEMHDSGTSKVSSK